MIRTHFRPPALCAPHIPPMLTVIDVPARLIERRHPTTNTSDYMVAALSVALVLPLNCWLALVCMVWLRLPRQWGCGVMCFGVVGLWAVRWLYV